MELIKVNDADLENILTSIKRSPSKLQLLIEMFMSSDEKVTKVVYQNGEYKSVGAAYGSLTKAVRRSRHRCSVRMHNKEIYLVKSDD